MKYHKNVLANGLRIITVPMKESQTAIVMILVEAGSEYEEKRINGLSHFLEHMCFKGTRNRTGDEISFELDALGASNNAFTGYVYTGYYAKARFKKIDKIIDVISDMYINPTFPEKDIDTERGVILEEMNMDKNIYPGKALELFKETIFGDQPAGRKIVGTEDNIKRFKRKDFVKYYETHYVPQKTVVVVAGNIDRKNILKQVEDKFGNLKKGRVVKKPKVKIDQKVLRSKILNEKIDQTHIVLGFRSFDLYDKRKSALKVVAKILGGSMSSRLFKKMRDELGMCYYVGAHNTVSIDHGAFYVHSGVTNGREDEALKVILDEMRKLRDEPIPAKELKKAKDSIMGGFANSLETSGAWADFYGDQELFHEEIETPSDVEKRIRAVTVEDVQKVLKQIMKEDRLNLAVVGPIKNEKKLKKVLKVV